MTSDMFLYTENKPSQCLLTGGHKKVSSNRMVQKLILASPRGFCAGVERAIDIVKLALKQYPERKVYVNHEIVHNRWVVDDFEHQGVIFTDQLDSVEDGSVYIFSAHGVAPSFRKATEDKDLLCIDATCPLVTKVHWEAEKFSSEGYKIFYIGQKNHQEALGVMDVADMTLIERLEDVEQLRMTNDELRMYEKTVVLTQTTLSVDDTKSIIDALRIKIPHLREPGDLCYATQNRQDAVKELATKSDFVIVIGSEASSNSRKLVVTSKASGAGAELFDTAGDIMNNIFDHKVIGLTSGASVPDSLVEAVIEKAKAINPEVELETLIVHRESVNFPLPKI